MLSIPQLIWISVKPIIKLFVMLFLGATLSRKGILTGSTNRAISQVLVLLLYPSLMFVSIASSINDDDTAKMGVLFVAAAFYIILGVLCGLFILYTLKPKNNIRNTVVMATSMGNWGDLTLAVILGLGDKPPFNVGDSKVGVAYVATFLVLCNFFFFTVGFASISKDFKQVDVEYVIEPVPVTTKKMQNDSTPTSSSSQTTPNGLTPDAALATRNPNQSLPLNPALNDQNRSKIKIIRQIQNRYDGLSNNTKLYINAVTKPVNVAIVLGFIIALTPALKAVFILSDREAPLSFLMELLQFLGNTSVPLGLLNLGAALGRLKVKNLGAIWKIITAVAVTRLVLIPLLSFPLIYFVVVRIPYIKEDPMLQFVLYIQSCVPTASSCVFFSQYHSPSGEANEIASIVLVQYIFCFITLTGALFLMLSFIN